MSAERGATADEALRNLARTRHLLVALDFDGTLAPLVDVPMQARMTPAARAVVHALAALPRTTVALVSGRGLADLRVIAQHDDDSEILLAASHGAEFWGLSSTHTSDSDNDRGAADARQADAFRAAVEAAVSATTGAWVERKPFGFAVHTRLVDSDVRPLYAIVDDLMVRMAPRWRRREGHGVVEYASRGEGKDTAIAVLRRAAHASAVLFAGDDVTDEDALRSLGAEDVGVRVGGGATAASVQMPTIDAFVTWLEVLVHERALAQE